MCPVKGPIENGAGDGNRTHVASLEGWNFTIKLHPHEPKSIITAVPALSMMSARQRTGFSGLVQKWRFFYAKWRCELNPGSVVC